jgi:Tol biopolymer transport system component
VRKGVALLVSLLAVAACTANGPLAPRPSASPSVSPSPSPGPTPSLAPSPSPSPSPSAAPSPVEVPAWAALHATCPSAPAAQEAVLQLQGAANPVLADVSDPKVPRTLCGISGGSFSPQLVTQTMISWYATQGAPGKNGTSVIAILDLFTGTSAVAATWSGGGFLDGVHAWSPDRGFLAYVASDATGVNLHVLSGGGDRVIATLGPVPGRGFNPNEDDAYLAFSPDGAYLALEQTFTSSGDQLQVRRTIDGSLAFSLSRATMATWGSSGSRLYFRPPGSGLVQVWDSAQGVSQAFGQQLIWIRPRSAVGADTTLAFTVRDSAGTPHTWLYSHDGRSGGQLPNVRSMPAWVNATAFFYVEEAACGSNCGIGPAWQPDGKTFTFDSSTQTETASKIQQVYGTWPRPGQT